MTNRNGADPGRRGGRKELRAEKEKMIRIRYGRKGPVFNKRKDKCIKIKNNPTHYFEK